MKMFLTLKEFFWQPMQRITSYFLRSISVTCNFWKCIVILILAACILQEDSGTVGIAQKNKQTIDAKFATLLLKVCRKLGEREINAKDLHIFLISCFPPGECIPRSADIHEVFEAITSNKLWDSWNYLPLKRIVEGFAADDQEIASWIEAYRQDLKSYKVTTKLFECIADASSNGNKPSEKPPTEYYQKSLSNLKRKSLIVHWNILMTFGMKLLASMTYLLMRLYLTPSARVVS